MQSALNNGAMFMQCANMADVNNILGPYNNGDVVDVEVIHNGNATCNLTFFGEGGALPCAIQGTCTLDIPIPDNSCPTTTDMIVPATAPGTQLGIDVFLNSVDLIASHTWNSDLEISGAVRYELMRVHDFALVRM